MSYSFFVTAPRHLEALLADELKAIGIDGVSETRGGAQFEGTLIDGYRACLWSRVANRVLLRLTHYTVESADDLYQGAAAVDWQSHIGLKRSFAIDFVGGNKIIRHSHFGALKVKDAIVDALRTSDGQRPSVETKDPDVRVNVHLHREHAYISIDLGGGSLHQRGYRARGGRAPLKENLAAAILLRSGWADIAGSKGSLVDPMCGSGTLLIEGAMIAADIAPGLLKRAWGFDRWPGHDADAWSQLISEAHKRRDSGRSNLPPMLGFDHDARAIANARVNAENAGLQGQLRFRQCPIAAVEVPADVPPGLVIVNPPYGERMGEESELPGVYRDLGKTLLGHFEGWRAALFTGNPDLAEQVGLRWSHHHVLFNGPIECRLFHFEVSREQRRFDLPRPIPEEHRSEGASAFANRLAKNEKNLARWRRREEISCYRVYDADLQEYALAIDIYDADQRYIYAQEYAPPHSVDAHAARVRLREALGVILDVFQIDESQLFLRVRKRQRGASQYEKRDDRGDLHEVREGPCRFLVNFTDYLDTGLFLDHRMTRQMIGEMADGKRFLNLFSYTASATVYAVLGGASQSTSVDMSRAYTEWARENLKLNGISGRQHQVLQADCLAWILEIQGKTQYDLIFLDPPSFSNSKRMHESFDVQRDHSALIRQCMKLLAPGGTLLFSNNRRGFKLEKEALSDFALVDLSGQSIPKDFERHRDIHCLWRIQHPDH